MGNNRRRIKSTGERERQKDLNTISTKIGMCDIMYKMIKTDLNAHDILAQVKSDMKTRGINGPTFSDAIRWMHNGYKKETN